MRSRLLLLAVLLVPIYSVSAQSTADKDAVHAAITDYLEGLYNVEPERIDRSVSTDLVKFGWYRSSPEAEYDPSPMTFDQLRDLASWWNKDNQRNIDESTPREIVIFDVLDKTASGKLTAYWGIDYFQLEKTDGQWKIRHVLWQSHPAGS